MTKSKVFITGIAGFLGSHLADRLLAAGHEVVGCDNMLGGYEDNVPRDAEFFKVDAQDFDKMKQLLKGVDIVYHCAAAPHEGLSVFSPKLITEHTYNSTVSTVSAAVINNLKRVVLCSSMARYGHQGHAGGTGGIFHEGMTPKPVDPYGVAKYASELFTEIMCETHGLEYVHAVPHNIFGPRQKYDDPYRNVISIMINRMLRGEQPIIYGDGEQKRSFTFVDDALNPLMKLGFQPDAHTETFNIGPDEEFITVNYVAKTIADLINFKLKPIYVDPRPREVKHAGCSADKARERLGYATTVSFKDGVQKTIDWIKMRGPKPFNYHLPLEIVNDKTPKTWTGKLI